MWSKQKRVMVLVGGNHGSVGGADGGGDGGDGDFYGDEHDINALS